MKRTRRRRTTTNQTEHSHLNGGLSNDYSFQAYDSSPHFSPYVQTKLKIGQPNDKYEQEADAMADKVMRMPDDTIQRAAMPQKEEEEKIQMKAADTPLKEEEKIQKKATDKPLKEEEEMIQKKADDELLKEEEEKIQMKTAGEGKAPKEEEELLQTKPIMMKSEGGESTATPALATQLNSTKGSGKSLAPDVNASMSNAFGTDFSHVRVHTDTRATQMNQDLHAKAFTHGSDIYFNQGQYAPTSSQGKKLLAHELTHVVQQRNINNNSDPINKHSHSFLQKKDADNDNSPSENRTIDKILDDAEKYYISIMDRRINAVNAFATHILQGNSKKQVRSVAFNSFVKAALFAASGGIAGIIARYISSSLVKASTALILNDSLSTAIKKTMGNSIEDSSNHATPSIGRFQELQSEAIEDAKLNAVVAEFKKIRQSKNKLEEAIALEKALKKTVKEASNQQMIANYTQWSNLLEKADKYGDMLGTPDGVLVIKFDIDEGLDKPNSISQDGVSEESMKGLLNREGTLGDLHKSGMTIRMNIDFGTFGWNILTLGGGGYVVGRDPADWAHELCRYCNERYNSQFSPEFMSRGQPYAVEEKYRGARGAAKVAGSIIWSRELSKITLKNLASLL